MIDEARQNAAADSLTNRARQAYLDVNEALGGDGVGAPPNGDREPFDPDGAFDASVAESSSFGLFSAESG